MRDNPSCRELPLCRLIQLLCSCEGTFRTWHGMKGMWAVLGVLIVSVLGKVKPVTLCEQYFLLVKTLISSRLSEQFFPWALPLKGNHCTGGVSNVQNRWRGGGGGGRKVGSAAWGRSLGSPSKTAASGDGQPCLTWGFCKWDLPRWNRSVPLL